MLNRHHIDPACPHPSAISPCVRIRDTRARDLITDHKLSLWRSVNVPAWYQKWLEGFLAPHSWVFDPEQVQQGHTIVSQSSLIGTLLATKKRCKNSVLDIKDFTQLQSQHQSPVDSPTLAQHLPLHEAEHSSSCCTDPRRGAQSPSLTLLRHWASPKLWVRSEHRHVLGLLECDLLILVHPGEKEHLQAGLSHTFQLVFHPALDIQISKIPQALAHLIIAHAIVYLVH